MTLKQHLSRGVIALLGHVYGWPGTRLKPIALGLRGVNNRLVPWAARSAFHDGVHEVNGIRMEIPRPPDWGGGGEFHMALGTYERGELAYVVARCKPGDIFIDVGAHVGYFTLPIARRVGARGRVIAIEPLPASADLLRRNVGLNGFDWVTVVQAAACQRDGQASFVLSDASAMWGALGPADQGHGSATLPVRTRSLDSLVAEMNWPQIVGIKVDVEGAELEVLRGAEEVLARNPEGFLMMEAAGGSRERIDGSLEALRWLEERGYTFRRLQLRGPGPVTDTATLASLLGRPSWYESLFNLLVERA